MTTAIEQLNNAIDLVAPELILLVTVCVMFITGPFFVSEAGVAPTGLRKRWAALSLVAIGCAWFIWFTSARTQPLGTGPFRVDDLTWYVARPVAHARRGPLGDAHRPDRRRPCGRGAGLPAGDSRRGQPHGDRQRSWSCCSWRWNW